MTRALRFSSFWTNPSAASRRCDRALAFRICLSRGWLLVRTDPARDGRHLFPVFPFDHFTKLTDADIKALYAYFMTRPAVKALDEPNTVPFPLDVRALQGVHPDVSIHLAAIDSHLNDRGYIVPGLGDAGDRQFDTL